MTRDAFVVGASNEDAVRTADAWMLSEEPLLVICGPKGAGKTHLAQILVAALRERAAAAGFIDDADRAPSPEFILAAAACGGGKRLVLAGRGAPPDWARGLKDLETRLGAAPRVTLREPDEALLRAVIVKMLNDRQLRASDALAGYAAPRLPKTFAAAEAFVAALDAAAIEHARPAGLKLAREIIDNLSEEPSGA